MAQAVISAQKPAIMTGRARHNSPDRVQTTTYDMGILHVPDDKVSTTVPLHPTCNPIKREIRHVNITTYPPRKDPYQSD
jgi:hypothetical protein